VKTWFQDLLFQIQLAPLQLGGARAGRELRHRQGHVQEGDGPHDVHGTGWGEGWYQVYYFFYVLRFFLNTTEYARTFNTPGACLHFDKLTPSQ
jgi:hypothetical protein